MGKVDFVQGCLASLEDDCAYDQPCNFGYRVSDHAVYCHNEKHGSRKCKWTWFSGKNREGYQDKDCPGFEPNPDYITNTEEK